MAQWAECLVPKYNSLSLDSSTSIKKLAVAACQCWEAGMGTFWGLLVNQSSQLLSSKFPERLGLKKQGRE